MENIKLGKIYASAIFKLANENNSVNEILELLNKIANELETNKEFEKFLANPIVETTKKIEVVNKLVTNDMEQNIVNYLVEKNRISLLNSIRNAYLEMYFESKNEIVVQAIFPTELTNMQKDKLVEKLEKLKGKKIILDIKVDTNLVTGGIISINDEVIDGSLKSQLDKIRESF